MNSTPAGYDPVESAIKTLRNPTLRRWVMISELEEDEGSASNVNGSIHFAPSRDGLLARIDFLQEQIDDAKRRLADESPMIGCATFNNDTIYSYPAKFAIAANGARVRRVLDSEELTEWDRTHRTSADEHDGSTVARS